MAATDDGNTWKAAFGVAIGRERIAHIVDDFYERVRTHPALSGPFSAVADWEEHKARLAHYWWLTLGGRRYRTDRYDLSARHLPLGMTPELLTDWLGLFSATLRDHLPDELARPWYEQARLIAGSLHVLALRAGGAGR